MALQSATTSLALNSHMDFPTLANLLRGRVPEDITTLSLHHIELDYNVAFEVINNLHKFSCLHLIDCKGTHVDQVVQIAFQNDTIYRLSLCAPQLDPSIVMAIGSGLKQQQLQQHATNNTYSTLTELILTIDMSVETTLTICNGMNGTWKDDNDDDHHHHYSHQQESLLPPLVQTTEHVRPKLSHLRSLDLSQCDFSPDAIAIFTNGLATNQHLERLKLENCRLEDYEVADIVDSLRNNFTLLELSLRLNYCEMESIRSIAMLLEQQQQQQQQQQHSENNNNNNNNVSSSSSSSSSSLQQLNLAQQNPGVLDLSILSSAIASNKSLRVLDLRENYLYDAHLPGLAKALTINSTLEDLNMENCEIGDPGYLSIVEQLPHMLGLKQLWLKENRFHEAAERTLRAVQQNPILRVLDLEDNLLSEELKYCLALKWGGRTVLSPNSIPLSMWPTVLARANRQRFRHNQAGTSNNDKFETKENDGDSDNDHDHDDDDNDDKSSNKNKTKICTTEDVLYCLLHGPAVFAR